MKEPRSRLPRNMRGIYSLRKLLIGCLFYFQMLNKSIQINSLLRDIIRAEEKGVWSGPAMSVT